ncbi:MAG: pyruvate kinase [Chloroflexota bacterium]|nr:MAG: pyruvate kinase [Chloroflexota bacterium]
MGVDSLPDKKTKIVCTIGPASQSPAILKELILAGMNIARINFAHGDVDAHRRVITLIRAAAEETGRRVAIMGDLPGPKMRIGIIQPDPLILERGQPFTLAAGEFTGDAQCASITFDGLAKAVKPDDRIFINDGFVKLRVEGVEGDEVRCRVLIGGELRSYKGVNFPGIDLGISAFTDDDRQWLAFAAAEGIDAVSQSFVDSAGDIVALREAAAAMNYEPFIIAKIERAGALQNMAEILAATDGIMVARGDLGVEIPIARIAIVQKEMIARANLLGKPVITATHMLESMTYNTRPTRAEATDVANAILDGTDCVMLSGETAIGENPVATVEVMADIARESEPHCSGGKILDSLRAGQMDDEVDTNSLVSMSIYVATQAHDTVAVVAPTLSGHTARMIGRFRLPPLIIAVSPEESTCQKLQFSYGVYPVYRDKRPESWERFTRDWIAESKLQGDLALLTLGSGTGGTGYSNRVAFIDLGRPMGDSTTW